MAIVKDKDRAEKVKKTVGKRLRSARTAARISEEQAAKAIGHTGLTQVSLGEKGDRLPGLVALIDYADLYGVSLDYLAGRISDPLAEPHEMQQNALAYSVKKSMELCLNKFVSAMTSHATMTMLSHQFDRDQLRDMAASAEELGAAMARFIKLNPEFEEDMQGGARLQSAVDRLAFSAQQVRARHQKDRELHEILERDVMEAMPQTPQLHLNLATS